MTTYSDNRPGRGIGGGLRLSPVAHPGFIAAVVAAAVLGGCAEPTDNERSIIADIQETFRERPPVPSGLDAPDWRAYVSAGQTVALPEGMTDVDVRTLSEYGTAVEIGPQARQRPVPLGYDWVKPSGEVIAEYRRTGREIEAGSARVAVYGWSR